MAKTYDIKITNGTTKESVTLYGSKGRGAAGLAPPLKGFSSPDVRTTSGVWSGSDGGYVSEQHYGLRQIPLNVFVYEKDHLDFQEAVQKMLRVFRIRDNLTLEIYTPTGNVFQTEVRLAAALDVSIQDFLTLADYKIELIAEDTLIYDYTEGAGLSVRLERPQKGGLLWDDNGLNWENDGLHWLEGGEEQLVTNRGTDTAYPEIVIKGTGSNMSVTNLMTNMTVQLNITMSEGDVLKINMKKRTITLNEGNVFNNAVRKEFWGLIPGDNKILLDYTGQDGAMYGTIDARSGYSGIF